MKYKLIGSVLISCFILSSCGFGTTDNSSNNIIDDVASLLTDTYNLEIVKGSYIDACPSATLSEMADGFMSSPSWREFEGTSGNTIVELSGGITFDGLPANALIQFEISGDSFEAIYLGINDIDQSLLMLSSLLAKMCEAA